jgi:hypothetical protein
VTEQEPYEALREEMDELMAMTARLPDNETIRLPAGKVRALLDLCAVVMDDAVEEAEQNKALTDTVSVAQKLLDERDEIIAGKKPLL